MSYESNLNNPDRDLRSVEHVRVIGAANYPWFLSTADAHRKRSLLVLHRAVQVRLHVKNTADVSAAR